MYPKVQPVSWNRIPPALGAERSATVFLSLPFHFILMRTMLQRCKRRGCHKSTGHGDIDRKYPTYEYLSENKFHYRYFPLWKKIIKQIGQKVYTQKIHIFCGLVRRIQPRSLHVLEVHSTFKLHSQPLGNLYYQTSLHKQQSSKI